MNKLPSKLIVNGNEVNIITKDGVDFYSLTNMTKEFVSGGGLIEKWLRTKHTIELLSAWEVLNNPNFKYPDFEGFKPGEKNFVISITEWVKQTNAIGIFSIQGSKGGTYAVKMIAESFAMTLSATYQISFLTSVEKREELFRKLIDQLKDPETYLKRLIVAQNYSCQTDSVEAFIVPLNPYTPDGVLYAKEADLLNVILYGLKDKEWRELNPKICKNKNQRDFSTDNQLLVLNQMQVRNATYIEQGLSFKEREKLLKDYAIKTLDKLDKLKTIDRFKKLK